jgi:hypothetical protein
MIRHVLQPRHLGDILCAIHTQKLRNFKWEVKAIIHNTDQLKGAVCKPRLGIRSVGFSHWYFKGICKKTKCIATLTFSPFSGRTIKTPMLYSHIYQRSADQIRNCRLIKCQKKIRGQARWSRGLRRGSRWLACWECGFECRRGHGYLSVSCESCVFR